MACTAPVLSGYGEVLGIEQTLRHASQTRRIRVSEFFKDYDPLRSGYITRTQFRRCLDHHLGVRLTEEDFDALADKYTQTDTGRINYKEFSGTFENVFDPNMLDGRPRDQIEKFESEATAAAPLPSNIIQETDEILARCQDYYKNHGINVKSCYRDFDRHHRGLVTHSQFHRSFPGPPEVTPEQISALAQRYCDPRTGLYNYLQFHNDIQSLGRGASEGATLTGSTHGPTSPKPHTSCVEGIFEKIRKVVYKNGIRTIEFFRDHDKLRSGVITENQFICGLSLCCGPRAQLSREEIQKVVQHYRTEDGRVRYKEFCDMMENSYNIPDFEKKPTATVYRPPRGYLSRPLNTLSSQREEEIVERVLQRLKREVQKRRLNLYPYFRDYDRSKGYTRGVTKHQFERLLDFHSLKTSPEELKLLMLKFENPSGGDVNYSAFIQVIDGEYTGQVVESEKLPLPKDSSPESSPRPSSSVDLTELIARLQEHIARNRIRPSEYFQDFDPLRSGYISTSRFRQGLSCLGQPQLTDPQFTALCQHYTDPSHAGSIHWKRFLSDVDPDPTTHPVVPTLLPVGAVDFRSDVEETEKDVLDRVMFRLKERVSQRRVLAKPCFQDFDRHHNGYVTKSQFRQCLSYLGLQTSEDEKRVMELRFSDDNGFNYLSFLEQLEPSEQLEDKYKTRMALLNSSGKAKPLLKTDPDVEVSPDQVLNIIKTKVSKERIRVLEFMRDYDKLRSGRIPLTSFRRALDLGGFELTPKEVHALEQRYLYAHDPNFMEYKKFSDEVESIFTKQHLEKFPTVEVHQFVPPIQVDLNPLLPEEEQSLQKTMHRLAERVRVRRIQIFPLFEDYDKVHIGSVTRSQFNRVLSELELGGLVSSLEFRLLYRKFHVKVGGSCDVNYIAFCDMVNDYAQTKWSDASLK